jgi:hypothetical protein
MSLRTFAARSAHRLKMKADYISGLKRYIQMYKLNWKKARDQIIGLQNQYATALESNPITNPESYPTDRIFADIVQNHGRHPNGRQYLREALLWVRHVYQFLSQACKGIKKDFMSQENNCFSHDSPV